MKLVVEIKIVFILFSMILVKISSVISVPIGILSSEPKLILLCKNLS